MKLFNLIDCPRHEGNFDCTPFCEICEGEQEYDPTIQRNCVIEKCTETIPSDIWIEELGFCVEHSHAYFNNEINPIDYTMEEN